MLISEILKIIKNINQSYKTKTSDLWLSGWGMGNWNEGGKSMHTSSHKINKYWGCNIQHNDCMAYLNVSKTVNPSSSHYKKKKISNLHKMMMLTKHTVVIISQYT